MNDYEPQRFKEGTFEWVQSFAEIESFLSPQFTGLSASREAQRVLVLGCGTSTLSKDLMDIGYGEVVSIDNDAACVEHMIKLHADCPRLTWFTYDLVEREGNDLIKSSHCDEAFDVVVDKGTLDAILVEGAVYTMLAEVHRFMKPSGVYLLCSINCREVLNGLVGVPALDFDFSLHSSVKTPGEDEKEMDATHQRYNLHTNPSANQQGMVAICKKRPEAAGKRVDLEALAQQEKEALDFYFKDEVPLLTVELETQLRARFRAVLQSSGAQRVVDSRHLHALLFNQAERAAYTHDLFLEDLGVFQRGRGRSINAGLSEDEAVEFLAEMQ